jgi:ADP-ribosylglycohydrolase
VRYASSRNTAHPQDALGSIHRGYLRWLHTQAARSAHPGYDDALDGWLIRLPELHSQRAPGNTCLSALRLPQPGTVQHPINDSKECGGMTRVAPIGLFGERSFDLACQSCAITHGHPSAYLAAGAFATILEHVMHGSPIPQAVAKLREQYVAVLSDEVRGAIDAALFAAAKAPRTPETVESLGAGWDANEALAIAIYCALVAHDFADGVVLAVNHSGDSDGTGELVGNLLGAAWGVDAIPAPWLAQLELREEIEMVADDLLAAQQGAAIDFARYPPY